MSLVARISDRVGISETQLAIQIVVLALGALCLLIVVQVVFDLVRYLAFHLKYRQSFVPRSWLFVLATSLWTMLTPARGQAIDHLPSASFEDSETSPRPNQPGEISSLLTCSIVITGLLLEIGKIRRRQLCKLEPHLALGHPVATATLTEQSLRAVQNADLAEPSQSVAVLLSANSNCPVFVPLGVSASQLVYVDLGKNSVVSIVSSSQPEQLAVFNSLIVSALFAASARLQIILLSKRSRQPGEFTDIFVVPSVSEVLNLVRMLEKSCIVFSCEPINEYEIDQLLDSGASIVCRNPTEHATTALRTEKSSWMVDGTNLSINPYGLSASQFLAIGELLTDVVRCSHEPMLSSTNSAVALENISDYKVLVRTLGPVDVELADGTIVKFEKSKTKELLAWLTSHRGWPTRSAARTALWEFTVADATFTNVVSDIRRTLNHTEVLSPFEEWIPRTFSDQLPFHHSIISDGEILQSCIARAKNMSADAAVAELHRGLALVRDLPFAGTNYLWPDAEGITSQLVMTVITAASMAAELDLQRGEIDGVFWATAQGLKVLGAHEELFALRMRAHALRGDLAGVRFEFDSYQRAIASDSFSITEPSRKLVNLLNSLTNSSTADNSIALTRLVR